MNNNFDETSVLGFKAHNGYNLNTTVYTKSESIKINGLLYKVLTIPKSSSFRVGLHCKNTNEVCMKIAISEDGQAYPLGTNNLYPAIGLACTLNGNYV